MSPFIYILGLLILSGLTIWLLILYMREEDQKFTEPMIINLMPQFSLPNKGHAIGLEVDSKVINNRILMEYQPRDVDDKYMKLKENKIENVKVVIDKNKVISLPRGTLSNFRTVKILLPPNAEDFSKPFKETWFGMNMMKMVEKINAENTEVDIVREGSNRKSDILRRLGDGEVSEEYLLTQQQLTKDLTKQVVADKPKDVRPSPFHNP